MKFARVYILLIALLALCAFATNAEAAKSKPNLKVTSLVVQSVTIHPGERLLNTATVLNSGRGAAGRSETTFFLSSDALMSKNDTTLQFKQKVGKLKKKKSARTTTEGAIPTSILPGTYFVAACADGTAKVKETKETDNCAFAKNPITVAAFPTSVNDGNPGPVSVPSNTLLPSITGSPGVGRALTAAPGTWTPSGVFLLRSWLLCTDSSTLGSCTAIAGAEGATYTPVAGDESKFIRVRVTGTNAGGSTSATSAATSAVVPDSDADGTPDDADCAPADTRLPGAGHPLALNCVGKIYDASNGNGVDGAVVALNNVLVTAIKSVDDGTVYVQIKPGDAGYDLALGAKFSGLEVSGAPGLHVGDRLNIYGILSLTSTGYVLGAETIDVLSSLNEAASPATISFTEFLLNALPYDGALISLPSITIASIDSAGWHVDLGGTPMTIGKSLIGSLPAATVGQNISGLKGIGESFSSTLTILPRTSGDVTLE